MSRARSLRPRVLVALVFIALVALLSLLSSYGQRPSVPVPVVKDESAPQAPKPRPTPRYKPISDPPPPIVDNFPLAASAETPDELPPIPSWNVPPAVHVKERTPLMLGFTRNWPLLQQAVVSYIVHGGWPPEDIYIVENTGTMDANRRGLLTLQNPFYLDHRRLKEIFGVNIITTPTLLTFAQLQNFYLSTAMDRGWDYYFWGHMDVLAMSDEEWTDPRDGQYKSLYARCVEDLRYTLATAAEPDDKGRTGGWAIRFHAYDRLAMVNRSSFEAVGGWDTMIPFYGTDCDMHERLTMAGYKQGDVRSGLVYDIGSPLEDLGVLYRRRPLEEGAPTAMTAPLREQPEDTLASSEYLRLIHQLDKMQVDKLSGDRNLWQAKQAGGKGEPYYRDARGFEEAIRMWQEHGHAVMAQKWGHHGCNLRGVGLHTDDAWKVEPDWLQPDGSKKSGR